jgi:sodium/hydrogen antiporter
MTARRCPPTSAADRDAGGRKPKSGAENHPLGATPPKTKGGDHGAMEWSLAIVALALLRVASISRRLSGTPITPTMLFVAIGLLVGPQVLDGIDLSSTSSTVQVLAEATLALVLFCDASRIDLGKPRREFGVPVRLLGIGLPLTITLGAVAAAAIFGQISAAEAIILAIVLAPTDAALGQAVVTEPRIPPRIRQGLNVESGLNDGTCVPLLFAAVAVADVESEISGGRSPATLLLEEIGYVSSAGSWPDSWSRPSSSTPADET